MIDIAEWAGFALLAGFAITIAWLLGHALWGRPEEGDAVWGSALTPLPALPTSPVEVIFAPAARIVRAVEHIGATELAPALGAIGTMAATPSDDLLTYAEQVAGDADEWSGFTQALVAYETAMLTRKVWEPPSNESAQHREVRGSIIMHSVRADHCVCNGTHNNQDPWCFNPVRESIQQRIDRWLSEGGDGVQHARSEVRQAVSETWDSPSRELALVDRPDAERVAEAALTA